MKGILIKSIGGFFFVASRSKEIYQCRIRGKIREKIYPGDYVEIDKENKILEDYYPRNNLLKRPKVANVDQVVIMHSIKDPEFAPSLLDRFLLLVESSGFEPLIVINKIDQAEVGFEADFEEYKEAGYELHFISVKENINLDKLFERLNDKINVLTGPSGAGKSSFLNKVIENADLRTAAVSKKLKKGVHTTRMVELLSLPNQGWVADTPGFSSMTKINFEIEPEDLSWYFPEIAQYNNDCKFNRCSHLHEPGCVVQKKVKNGEISERRYKSYKQIYNELEKKERRY
ncbi:MAG: ribosome bioproteinis GTPase [Halanaerobium sp. 4-GBenrich]|jgi:ribosome biogenesis GTPase|uniref:Small ribosomal subunit biogenesis GTPase RsgA n=1 Tax=Halanaerobium congolense TaxID=54121 RepID=A0A1M7HHT6_9FIRM|nr:ribosome small subunit-dependent GTPase A [Halanaerobium congolense]KXS50100.1 MAG: ribosome bioproteinis GTPase [Halanaerobium sp. T82-1]ODS50089.1 MAG: ribosome bioproteinis GTPase [Halanaerobium sp. 4-GBenrich]OEG63079.1 MAG: ribosome small subunit-dependent GTPase A [Halanaerobium sp. MDAL1]PUU90507.1 MAG: ribosome bioproteinis GTPase [Halanaerobium sp.]PTX16895.1 ribosome biogenesis GTPase [Halanaerobium congolense]